MPADGQAADLTGGYFAPFTAAEQSTYRSRKAVFALVKGLCQNVRLLRSDYARLRRPPGSWRNIASLTMPALSSTFFPHCSIDSEMSAISLS
jgi:hypothetical protein